MWNGGTVPWLICAANGKIPMTHGPVDTIPEGRASHAAYTLLAQGVTASEAVTRLSQRFGLSQRQAYGYVQDARAMGQPAEPAEELIPITIKIPGTLAETLRAHARSSGHSIGEIVARVLRRIFSDTDRHG